MNRLDFYLALLFGCKRDVARVAGKVGGLTDCVFTGLCGALPEAKGKGKIRMTFFAVFLYFALSSAANAQLLGGSFEMGRTDIFPKGNLKNYFGPTYGINFAFNLYFEYLLTTIQANFVGDMLLKTPLPKEITGFDADFQINDKFFYEDWGLFVGLPFEYKHLLVAPFVYLGGAGLRSDREEIEDYKLEYKMLNSFFFGPGLRTEIQVFRYNKRETGYAFFAFRFDIGYNIPVKYRFTPAKGNIPYARLSLVWGGKDY